MLSRKIQVGLKEGLKTFVGKPIDAETRARLIEECRKFPMLYVDTETEKWKGRAERLEKMLDGVTRERDEARADLANILKRAVTSPGFAIQSPERIAALTVAGMKRAFGPPTSPDLYKSFNVGLHKFENKWGDGRRCTVTLVIDIAVDEVDAIKYLLSAGVAFLRERGSDSQRFFIRLNDYDLGQVLVGGKRVYMILHLEMATNKRFELHDMKNPALELRRDIRGEADCFTGSALDALAREIGFANSRQKDGPGSVGDNVYRQAIHLQLTQLGVPVYPSDE